MNSLQIKKLLNDSYSCEDIELIFKTLQEKGTFKFEKFKNGLYPAATLNEKNKYTNYEKVWVRDNYFVAFAHYVNREYKQAIATIKSLGNFFYKYKHKFENIINGLVDYNIPMNRPHIRFNGQNLSELNENWAHAQNDALGYYFWFTCKLANENKFNFRKIEQELFPLFILYFKKIKFWEDEDNGHWEENRKIEASSIGVVTKALIEAKDYIKKQRELKFSFNSIIIDSALIEDLIKNGENSLREILPNECIQKESQKNRKVDAALLFLIYPLDITYGVLKNEDLEDKILNNVIENLKGDYGIKRYIGDSFWTANTKLKQKKSEITADYSERIGERNKNHVIGEEAQWCIFDSIISIIYGIKCKRYKLEKYLKDQIYYFNRSLSQLTGDECIYGSFKCPELYYLENGKYIVNDTVPLLWAQANLWMAFYYMQENLFCASAKNH